MQMYKEHAPQLAHEAASQLLSGDRRREITHIIVGSCTGFYAPGVDFDLIRSLGLRPTVQRRLIGFMGCYAGLSVLQTAYEIVRANQESKVLTVNVELSSLHLQKPTTLEQVMGFAQFADGCGAALVSSEPRGLQLHGFQSAILSDYASAITWDITDQGFEMYLDARLPRILMQHFPMQLFPQGETAALWAIHPGGKSILDVVQKRLELSDEDLAVSRGVLKRFGNMSSATILFVLKEMIDADREHAVYENLAEDGTTKTRRHEGRKTADFADCADLKCSLLNLFLHLRNLCNLRFLVFVFFVPSCLRGYLSRNDKSMPEMSVVFDRVQSRGMAKLQDFTLCESLSNADAGVVDHHRIGKEGEERDPGVGALASKQIGDDDPAAGQAIHFSQNLDRVGFAEMVQEHRAVYVVEALVGKREQSRVRLNGAQMGSFLAGEVNGFGVQINHGDLNLQPAMISPGENAAGNIGRSGGDIEHPQWFG
jgi:predicted naringenin-chalcone synthase